METLRQARRTTPTDPKTTGERVPPSASAMNAKTMKKEPKSSLRRDAFLDAGRDGIGEYGGGRPVTPLPPSTAPPPRP
jgi:hypothetical protein